MDTIPTPLILLFFLMWLIGFVWQFYVIKVFYESRPENYPQIYPISVETFYKEGIRLSAYLLMRRFRNIENRKLSKHLDIFRWYLFALVVVFAAVVIISLTYRNG